MTQKMKKSDLYKNKWINSINDIGVNKILVSKKESYGIKNSFKYFIGYNDNNIIRPLCTKLPQIIGYTRKFDKNVTMSFRVDNKQLLKNCNKIWEKIEKLLTLLLIQIKSITLRYFEKNAYMYKKKQKLKTMLMKT